MYRALGEHVGVLSGYRKLKCYLIKMRDLLKDFNRILKEERSKYFSQLIAANPPNPRLLLKTIIIEKV